MSKVYQAQEMRDTAFFFDRNADQFSKARSNSVLARIPETIAMLRQAADVLEREEKREVNYEYAVRTHTGKIYGQSSDIVEVRDEVAFVNADGLTICNLVRRPVGEWEEVNDGR